MNNFYCLSSPYYQTCPAGRGRSEVQETNKKYQSGFVHNLSKCVWGVHMLLFYPASQNSQLSVRSSVQKLSAAASFFHAGISCMQMRCENLSFLLFTMSFFFFLRNIFLTLTRYVSVKCSAF